MSIENSENDLKLPVMRDEQGRFLSGYSGNVGGRPKGYNFKKALAHALNDTDVETAKMNIVAIVDKAVQMAKDGNIKAIAWVADRFEGKPQQRVDVNDKTDEDGNYIVFTTIEDETGIILFTSDRIIKVKEIGEKYLTDSNKIG